MARDRGTASARGGAATSSSLESALAALGTTLFWSALAALGTSGMRAPQPPQNRAPAGMPAPHFPQTTPKGLIGKTGSG